MFVWCDIVMCFETITGLMWTLFDHGIVGRRVGSTDPTEPCCGNIGINETLSIMWKRTSTLKCVFIYNFYNFATMFKQFDYTLISTSTPAGKSSFIKASTVFSVGSTMSIKRWCVRISNWSREVLFTWGDRNTSKRWMRVGNGTGPLTIAPVRFAVSTISAADWSIKR